MTDFSKLFRISGSVGRTAIHLTLAEPLNASEVIGYFTGALRPPRPVRLMVQSGSRHGDWVSTTYPPLRVVSRRLLELLAEKSFTGWGSFPVQIAERGGHLVEGYEGFAVTGRCGPLDATRSQEAIRPPISPHGNAYPVREGLYFEESSWDGSDIFRPEGTGFVICTDAVRRCLTKSKMKNLRFEPLTEFEMLV